MHKQLVRLVPSNAHEFHAWTIGSPCTCWQVILCVVCLFYCLPNQFEAYNSVVVCLFLFFFIVFVHSRFWYGWSDAGRMEGWWNGGSDALGKTLGAQSLGGFVRPTENDSAISTSQPNGPQPLFAVWLPIRSSVSSTVDQLVQKSTTSYIFILVRRSHSFGIDHNKKTLTQL